MCWRERLLLISRWRLRSPPVANCVLARCLLNPPSGYALGDLELGKRFVSDLLAGETVRIEGSAPWLAQAQLLRTGRRG